MTDFGEFRVESGLVFSIGVLDGMKAARLDGFEFEIWVGV